MATKTEQDNADAAFAEQFNSADVEQQHQSDDDAFGLSAGSDQAGGAAAAGAGGADDAEAAGAAAAPAAAAAAPEDAERTKALDDREAALAAREQELNGREAAMKTTNVNEEQTSTVAGAGKEDAEDSGANDPAAALAEDFGPEFVQLLKAFILDVCKGHVTDQLGGLQGQVQSVIEDLQNQRNKEHFKAIEAAHEKFLDIIESQEFTAWLESLPQDKQTDMRQVMEAGSSQDIIDMLSDFKSSKAAAGGDATGRDATDENALNNAEGVRSVGLRLPTAPKESEDYAAAWNQA